MGSEARRRGLAVLVLVGTFVAGGATGAGVMASLGRHHGPPHGPRGKHLPPPLEELGLDDSQRMQAEAIFEKYRAPFEAVFQESQPKLRALREQLDAEVLPLLTEAQRARFEELKKSRPERPPLPPR